MFEKRKLYIYFFDVLKLCFLLIFAMCNNAFGQSFDPQDLWLARYFEKPIVTQPLSLSTATAEATIRIEDKVLAPVLPTQFGVNSNFRSTDALVGRSGLYEGFGSFRFPAGSGSDQYFWDCQIPDDFLIDFTAYCGTAAYFLDPDHFIDFKNNADGEATIVINYMYARYGIVSPDTRAARVAQAADYAAAFVQYMNVVKGANIRFWEIGNECYGQWETGYDVNGNIISGTEYGEDFLVFSQKMKNIDPTIHIGAVLWHRSDRDWNEQVLEKVGNVADFLIVHHYFKMTDLAGVKTALEDIRSDMDEIQQKAALHSTVPLGKFPLAFTEFNIQDAPVTTMLNGQFVAEALLTMAEEGFFMNTIWVNEWRITNNDTKGLLSFEDPEQADFTPRPSYTPFYFLDKYLGDYLLESNVTGTNTIRAHASRFADGELGLLVLNYGSSPQTVRIESAIFGDQNMDLYMHSVHAQNINIGNKKFFVNGTTGTTPSGGPELSAVPAFRATYSKDKAISLPAHSASYLTLQNKTSSNTGRYKTPPKIYPNPCTDHLAWQGENGEKVAVFNMLGQKMEADWKQDVDGMTSLNVAQLQTGMYYLLLMDEHRVAQVFFQKI